MTNKLEQAARQALEALEKTGIEGTWLLHDEAITALREALRPEVAPDGRVAKTVFTLDDMTKAFEEGRKNGRTEALAEQAEQEPVAIEELAWEKYCEDTAGDMDVRDFWEELPKSVQQQYIAKVSCSYPNCNCPFDHPGGDWCAKGLSTNATPVRTKDPTDAFINELHKDAQDPITFARAVIAADRSKNGII